jgi:hypothetical protein
MVADSVTSNTKLFYQNKKIGQTGLTIALNCGFRVGVVAYGV